MNEQIELNVSITPEEAQNRIVGMSDDVTIRSDKEAWLSLFRGLLFVQKRTGFQRSWYDTMLVAYFVSCRAGESRQCLISPRA